MVVFSCCREVYSPNRKHKDGLPGPISAAQACLEDRNKVAKEKKIEEDNYNSDLNAAKAKIEALIEENKEL